MVYDTIRDPSFKYNPISTRDQNLGLWISNNVIRALARADKYDDRQQDLAAKRGEAWNRDTSQLRGHSYFKGNVTLREYIAQNVDKVYDVAVESGGMFLEQAKVRGGRRGNVPYSAQDIEDFKKVVADRTLTDENTPPSLTKYITDGGKKVSDEERLGKLVSPPDFTLLNNVSRAVLVRVVNAVKNDLVKSKGYIDLPLLVADRLQEVYDAYPGLKPLAPPVPGKKVDADTVLRTVIYGDQENKIPGLVNEGYSTEDVEEIVNNIKRAQAHRKMLTPDEKVDEDIAIRNNGYKPLPGPSPEPGEKPTSTASMQDMQKQYFQAIDDIEKELSAAVQSGDRNRIRHLSAQREQYMGELAKINEYLGQNKTYGREESKQLLGRDHPMKYDLAAYNTRETGWLLDDDTYARNTIATDEQSNMNAYPPAKREVMNGKRSMSVKIGRNAETGEVDLSPQEKELFLKGVDKLVRMNAAYMGGNNGLIDRLKKTINNLDDKESAARYNAILDEKGDKGVVEVISEIMSKPSQYTATLKDGKVKQADAFDSIRNTLSGSQKAMLENVGERVRNNQFDWDTLPVRALPDEEFGFERPRDLGRPGEFQSTMSQGPDVDGPLLYTQGDSHVGGDPHNPSGGVIRQQLDAHNVANRKDTLKDYYKEMGDRIRIEQTGDNLLSREEKNELVSLEGRRDLTPKQEERLKELRGFIVEREKAAKQKLADEGIIPPIPKPEPKVVEPTAEDSAKDSAKDTPTVEQPASEDSAKKKGQKPHKRTPRNNGRGRVSDSTTADSGISQKDLDEYTKNRNASSPSKDSQGDNKKPNNGSGTMTEKPKEIPANAIADSASVRKTALDTPFSQMLKASNDKVGQEKGLPSGATMRETLPAYYRTVKMVGDHPDAIGFSVYEHKKMNAEDGEEHKTDLPKPIKKGTVEYVEKSSIRDLIQGEHIAKRWQDEPQGAAPGDELEDEIQNGVFANEVAEGLRERMDDVDVEELIDEVKDGMTPKDKRVAYARGGSIKYPVGHFGETNALGSYDEPTLDEEINSAIDDEQDDPANDRNNYKVSTGSIHEPAQHSNNPYTESFDALDVDTYKVTNPNTGKTIVDKEVIREPRDDDDYFADSAKVKKGITSMMDMMAFKQAGHDTSESLKKMLWNPGNKMDGVTPRELNDELNENPELTLDLKRALSTPNDPEGQQLIAGLQEKYPGVDLRKVVLPQGSE